MIISIKQWKVGQKTDSIEPKTASSDGGIQWNSAHTDKKR